MVNGIFYNDKVRFLLSLLKILTHESYMILKLLPAIGIEINSVVSAQFYKRFEDSFVLCNPT